MDLISSHTATLCHNKTRHLIFYYSGIYSKPILQIVSLLNFNEFILNFIFIINVLFQGKCAATGKM